MDIFLVSTFACMALAFAVCGIPFGLIIAQRLNGVDVREAGSGNIGMTNVARTAGAGAAALTFACDVGKGLLCMTVARLVLSVAAPEGVRMDVTEPGFAALTLVYAACVLGHIFSPYLGFHGGKGISVGFGAALGLYWPIALCLMACFLVAALPSGYVSAGSLIAAALLPVQCLFLWHLTPWAVCPITLVSAVVIWAHRGNIHKLLRGQESRFTVKRGADGKSKVPPTRRRGDDQNA